MTIDAGRFTWFEQLSNDAGVARRFYSEVLPWKVQDFPMAGSTYPMIKAGEASVGGLAPLPPGAKQPCWLSYVSVDDVDAAAKRVKANGGTALMDAIEIPGVGRMQAVADPHGAAFMLMRGVDGDNPEAKGAGTFHWNELWSPDPKAAVDFYGKVLGYTHTTMEMPGGRTYYVLASDGKSRGGVMQSPVEGIPPHWLPYVNVTDLDGTIARVTRNGGKTEGDAMEVPGVGRFAFVRDPQGARLGLITPNAAS